jgi:hypothetical protein
MIYLFEFYEHKGHQVHSVFEEYLGDTIEKALENLEAIYPDSLVLNTYIHTHSLGVK